MPGWPTAGCCCDLNAMLARDPDFAAQLKADGITALYDTFAFGGGQYALPEQWSGNFVFYNKALFAEAGGLQPPARWEQPWTFAEFLATATALTKRDGSGKVTQWGFVDTWVPYYSAGLFGMNNGTPWCRPRTNPTHLNFDDDAFIEGVQFYADLAGKHRVAPKAADQQSISTMDLFSSGMAAMALGGHWRYQTFARADVLDFDITVLPVGPKGRGAQSNIGTTGLAIAASSSRKQQAWEFVKFATGPVGQALIGESGLFVPVLDIRDPLPRIRPRPHQDSQSGRAHRRAGSLGLSAGHPGVAEDRRTDGPRDRARAARHPARDIAEERAVPRHRPGATRAMTRSR